MEIVSNYDKKDSVEDDEFEMEKVIARDFQSILDQGERNAKCENDYSSIKMRAKPIENNDGSEIKFKNSVQDECFDLNAQIFDLMKKYTQKVEGSSVDEIEDDVFAVEGGKKPRKKYDDDGDSYDSYDEDDDEEVPRYRFPLEKLRERIKKMGQELTKMSYLTICQMYDGILIDEQLTIRKGLAYAYKHQRELSAADFFSYLINNKEEVYKKLGSEKAVLIEELLNRLVLMKIMVVKEISGSRVIKKIEFEDWNDRPPYELEGDLGEELEKIRHVVIRFENPIKVVNCEREESKFAILRGICIQHRSGIEFFGDWVERSGLKIEGKRKRKAREYGEYEIRELSLNNEIYNYLVGYYKEIIDSVITQSEFLMKKVLFDRMVHKSIMLRKCNKYLLVAGIRGINVKEQLNYE